MSKRVLYIRADGNEKIGMGHLMRCASIAEALKRQGVASTFITSDSTAESWINRHGYTGICLGAPADPPLNELAAVRSLILERQISCLLVDSYHASSEYLGALRSLTTVIYMDDLDRYDAPCQILVNYHGYADERRYSRAYPGRQLLLGPRFAPLRRQFQARPRAVLKAEAESMLITTGGSDEYYTAGRLIRLIQNNHLFRGMQIHVVSGEFNPYLEKLKQLERADKRMKLHAGVRNMAELMCGCEIAVSSGGSTLYELCACGVPTVVFTFADNQIKGARTFAERGLMIYSGDIRENAPGTAEKMIMDAADLIGDRQRRYEMSSKMQSLVDGNGAERIAQAISACIR